MMKTMINEILQLLTASQDELFDSLENRLQTYGYTTQKTAYALGAKSQEAYAPTVVAHLDTRNINTLPTRDDIKVTDEWIGLSEEANDALDCLGADDRAGVASILILLDKGYRPNVLFTRDEELGCLGTRDLIDDKHNWSWLEETCLFIQVDRGSHEGSWHEMVFYHYDYQHIPEIFEQLAKHYDLARGSNTDVALLGKAFNKPLVNLSASYRYEHHREEELSLVAFKANQVAFEAFITWINSATGRDKWDYKAI